ncbi:hypothetical protein PAXRUDRAFT_831720, partial [Paxillus rubicundulus Ve08.2h10]
MLYSCECHVQTIVSVSKPNAPTISVTTKAIVSARSETVDTSLTGSLCDKQT